MNVRPPSVDRNTPALFVWTVGMTEDGHEQPIRVAGIDDDLRNLLAVAKTEVRPRRAGVGGFVDAVTRREVRPLQSFPAADVDDVRIRRRDGDRADGACGLVVEDRMPRTCRSPSIFQTPPFTAPM